MGIQQGTHFSRNGFHKLIPWEGIGPEAHRDETRTLEHPFQKPANLSFDLSFAALSSAKDPIGSHVMRGQKFRRLKKQASITKPIDDEICSRMSAEVKVAASSPKLTLLTTLLFVARWPD